MDPLSSHPLSSHHEGNSFPPLCLLVIKGYLGELVFFKDVASKRLLMYSFSSRWLYTYEHIGSTKWIQLIFKKKLMILGMKSGRG